MAKVAEAEKGDDDVAAEGNKGVPDVVAKAAVPEDDKGSEGGADAVAATVFTSNAPSMAAADAEGRAGVADVVAEAAEGDYADPKAAVPVDAAGSDREASAVAATVFTSHSPSTEAAAAEGREGAAGVVAEAADIDDAGGRKGGADAVAEAADETGGEEAAFTSTSALAKEADAEGSEEVADVIAEAADLADAEGSERGADAVAEAAENGGAAAGGVVVNRRRLASGGSCTLSASVTSCTKTGPVGIEGGRRSKTTISDRGLKGGSGCRLAGAAARGGTSAALHKAGAAEGAAGPVPGTQGGMGSPACGRPGRMTGTAPALAAGRETGGTGCPACGGTPATGKIPPTTAGGRTGCTQAPA